MRSLIILDGLRQSKVFINNTIFLLEQHGDAEDLEIVEDGKKAAIAVRDALAEMGIHL